MILCWRNCFFALPVTPPHSAPLRGAPLSQKGERNLRNDERMVPKEPLINSIFREQQHNSSGFSRPTGSSGRASRGVFVTGNTTVLHSPRPEGPLLMWNIAN